MSKLTKVYLPENIAEAVIKEAYTEQLSVSSYITSILAEELKDVIDENETETENETDNNEEQTTSLLSSRVVLTGEDAIKLKEKAAKLGISPTAYIRNMVYTKDFRIVDFTTDDLEGYLADIHSLINAITSCINLSKRYSGMLQPQDVELIKNNLNKMIKLAQEQIVISLNDRKSVYKKMMKKAKED